MSENSNFQRDAESRYGGTIFNLKPVTQDPPYPRDGDSWFRVDEGLIKVKLDGVIYGMALVDDITGKLIGSQLPNISINHVFIVNSEAEQTALSAVIGDVAIRTDENLSYILAGLPASTFSNWTVLTNVTATVSSVNGKVGVVVLTTTDIGEGTHLYYTQGRFDSAFAAKSTTDLVEGTNLYYTNARFDARLATKTTSNLSEGANLYYTTARANTDFDNRLATKDTDDLSEGSTNLYYTNSRFDNRFATKTTTNLSEGTNLYYTQARFDTAFAAKSTDDLSEGTAHLYFTNARFDTRFATKSTTDLAEGTNLYYTASRFNTAFAGKTTSDLTEGGNLYYTSARFDTAFSGKSTTNLTEGTNLYYTTARANTDFDTRLATKTTDNLTEGSTNLYYTNARVDAQVATQKGVANGLATLDGTGKIPASQLPGEATIDTNIVASQAAMLALTAQKGDIAKRTDTKEIYILRATPATTLSNWELLSTDYNANVDTVNGFSRTVALSTTDIPEGTNLYYLTSRFNTDFATKTTSDLTEGSNLYYTAARFNSAFASKTTSDLTEGTNLYYTTARANADFDTRLATKTTTNLAEGSNLYYTTARANADFDTRLATKTTDNLPEGSTNLYYTNTRFDNRFATKTTTDLTEGTNLYYTNVRADARITAQKGVANGLATLDGTGHVPLTQISITTSDVPEGTNLYYTDARADARIALQKGVANGIATLDAGGLIPTSQLPALAITNTFVVSSQAAMLALTAQTGDIAIRTDLSESFILQGTDPTILANWQQLLSPAAPVQSVNGFTGNVVLTTTNIAEGTNLYYTDARVRAAVSGVSPIIFNSGNGQISIQKADATHDGYLSQGDWTTFNGKEPAITAGTTLQYYRGDKTFQTLNTSAVPEGSNLYYTDARFDTRFGTKSTTNLTEGTNLYYTDARVRLNRLDQMAAPTADVSMNSHKLTNVTDPTSLQDAATKAYVDYKVNAMTSPSQITANQNDYNPGSGRVFRLTSDANNRQITGLAISGVQDGQTIILINVNTSNFNISIRNQDSGSLAANRFQTSTNANISLGRYSSITFIYDATTQVWRDL